MEPDPTLSTTDALRSAVLAAIPDATVEITSSGGGHYSLAVKAPGFRGRPMLECHRMVYSAIAPLMAGDMAPVHAIDTLKTMVG